MHVGCSCLPKANQVTTGPSQGEVIRRGQGETSQLSLPLPQTRKLVDLYFLNHIYNL